MGRSVVESCYSHFNDIFLLVIRMCMRIVFFILMSRQMAYSYERYPKKKWIINNHSIFHRQRGIRTGNIHKTVSVSLYCTHVKKNWNRTKRIIKKTRLNTPSVRPFYFHHCASLHTHLIFHTFISFSYNFAIVCICDNAFFCMRYSSAFSSVLKFIFGRAGSIFKDST